MNKQCRMCINVLIDKDACNKCDINMRHSIKQGVKGNEQMKIIVLHDRYSNEPIIIRVDAITAIKKEIDRIENSKDEYSKVNVSQIFFDVKEHIDVVMLKIQNAESEIKKWE